MSLRTAIRSILIVDPEVSRLLKGRIYAQRPQNRELPVATMRQITCPQVESLDGPSGIARPRWQLTFWGTPDQAEAAANAVNNVLNGWRGESEGITIHMIRRLSAVEFDEDPQQGQSMPERAIVIDYEVSHSF